RDEPAIDESNRRYRVRCEPRIQRVHLTGHLLSRCARASSLARDSLRPCDGTGRHRLVSPLEELATARMAKAEDAMRDGVFLLEKGSLSAAINRFYYASFYAARALLATRDRDSKSHAGII